MPVEAYEEVLDENDGQEFIQREQLKIILYNAEREVILRWIE